MEQYLIKSPLGNRIEEAIERMGDQSRCIGQVFSQQCPTMIGIVAGNELHVSDIRRIVECRCKKEGTPLPLETVIEIDRAFPTKWVRKPVFQTV